MANMNQIGIYLPRIKIDKKRIIKFLIAMGIFFIIDIIFNIRSMFNRTVQSMVLLIFNIKTDVIHSHSSLLISIAVLWSSKLKFAKKIEYSASLIIIYAWIFTITTAIGLKYPSFSFYITLIVLITMTFPIILWILS